MTDLRSSRGTHVDAPRARGTSGSPTTGRASLEAGAATATVALGWALMAQAHPTTTYHFAPLVLVAITTLYVRTRLERPLTFRQTLSLAGFGAVIALITTAVLENVNALRGPTLWGPGGALAETLLAIAVGLLIGLTAMMGRRGREAH